MVSMRIILPNPVTQRKANLPDSVNVPGYPLRMKPLDTKPILWENLKRLMAHHWGKENLSRLCSEAGVGLATADRIKKQATSVGLDKLEAIAGAFDLQAWHLLTPNLDPSNPPVIALTRSEAELYKRLRETARGIVSLE